MLEFRDPSREGELLALIRQRLGLRIEPPLHGRILEHLRETCERFAIADHAALCELVRSASATNPAFEHLIAGITVGESHFFRDRNHMAFLEREHLPALIARRRAEGNLTLRIWSAGCSDGQELYSLLLLLHRLLPDAGDWALHLLGTDINRAALQRAMTARYSEWSMRGVDDTLRASAFEPVELEWRLRLERYPASLRFEYLNLVEDEYPSLLRGTHAQDLILCRNVFIYFDLATVEAIVARLARSLAPGGVLLPGACDRVPQEVPGLIGRANGEVFHYCREATDLLPSASPITAPPFPSMAASSSATSPGSSPPFASDTPGARAEATGGEGLAERICALVDRGETEHALELLESTARNAGEEAEWARLRGYCLAGMGRLDEARESLRHAIATDRLDPDGHFLCALVEMELGDAPAAEAALRRVLLLDPEHILAHYHAGMIKLRGGRLQAGRLALERARTLLLTQEANGGTGTLRYGGPAPLRRLAEILRHELELHRE